MTHHTSRRAFLGTAAATALAVPALSRPAAAHSPAPGSEDMVYEVTRTEAEWRAHLTPEEYRIMRELGTEPRFASDLWDEDRAGHYHCQGCDLTLYESTQKTVRQIGWVFFYHARPDSVLLSIDGFPYGDADDITAQIEIIEAHCRRCGSHLGHIIQVGPDLLHCINGAALDFALDDAA